MEEGGETKEGRPTPIFRDIRRYNCDYCGISRSKKSLITSHILSVHQDEMKARVADEEGESEGAKSNTCEDCGASFQKPAHLKQHMQSHSLERPFICQVEDCHSSYRRKDHLTRHLLQHQGKLFQCPAKSCNRRFTFQGNMKRHVKEFHDEESPSSNVEGQKEYICQEIGCGKVFKYASKLRTHENSHVKLDTVEVFCSEPGCMKHFSNEECLKAHLQSCHVHITCEVCGTKQLKKNIKRHLRMHESGGSSERMKCNFKGCQHTFSTKSNLRQHVKAVHFELKPFACSIPGCGMRFPFKHVRDNHEKSALHVYTRGDFDESDEQFRLRPRGGRKRKCPTIESLTRKRVIPPSNSDSILNQGSEYLSWLLSDVEDDYP
ncbi:transcription factor IIIA-like isoform X1 [Cornus florida]|uniref:transcription factor IIIA-like isoform X1 n=1 Tax=Cornus florida TaxID=4283 RepID=UPI00289EB942|nr:transcription factor IIIA-like isoform X1 [Cornus florida]